MFNSENNTKKIPVTVTLTDQSVHTGNLIIAMTSDLPRSLNGDTRFLEFENLTGDSCYFSVHSLCQVTPTDIPKVRKLDAGTDSDEDFNPFQVLKIAPDSDAETIQKAYYDRAKMYHPDRFSASELPDEMARYVDNMSRLINAAFQTLSCRAKTPAAVQQTCDQKHAG